jgi:hypothetical protein
LLDLPALKKLRMVALTGRLLAEWQRLLSEHHSFATVNAFITRFFGSHPSLEHFYVNEMHTSKVYQRWKRGEEHPTEVNRSDFADFYGVLGFDCSLIGLRALYARTGGV